MKLFEKLDHDCFLVETSLIFNQSTGATIEEIKYSFNWVTPHAECRVKSLDLMLI